MFIGQVMGIIKSALGIKENPQNNKFGQTDVAVVENFWSHAIRYGRTATKLVDGSTITQNVISSSALTATAGTVFYPKNITASADIDCVIYISYLPHRYYDTFDTNFGDEYIACAFCKAGTPLVVNLDGNVKVAHPGGNVSIKYYSTTASGKAYACIQGVEVARDV